jgi:hypothetical protein
MFSNSEKSSNHLQRKKIEQLKYHYLVLQHYDVKYSLRKDYPFYFILKLFACSFLIFILSIELSLTQYFT